METGFCLDTHISYNKILSCIIIKNQNHLCLHRVHGKQIFIIHWLVTVICVADHELKTGQIILGQIDTSQIISGTCIKQKF